MVLYEFCQTMVNDFKLGDHEMRIISEGTKDVIFVGTFNEFLLRKDFTVQFISSIILGLSMVLWNHNNGTVEYVTIVSI